jgi:hypothetical protein
MIESGRVQSFTVRCRCDNFSYENISVNHLVGVPLKKHISLCLFFILFSSNTFAAPLVHNKEKLQEAAAFTLGVEKKDVIVEESDHSPEANTEYFLANYKGKKYQCYVTYLQTFMSAAPCMPMDGSALPGGSN